jgi:hypothetical protein
MRTIEIRQFRDRNDRLWEQVPNLGEIERLRHEFVGHLGTYGEVEIEREIVEYLVGPLEEVS